MSEDLKPCPFCGGKPEIMEESGGDHVGYATTCRIRCKCGASMVGVDDKDKNGWACKSNAAVKAISAWNKRCPEKS